MCSLRIQDFTLTKPVGGWNDIACSVLCGNTDIHDVLIHGISPSCQRTFILFTFFIFINNFLLVELNFEGQWAPYALCQAAKHTAEQHLWFGSKRCPTEGPLSSGRTLQPQWGAFHLQRVFGRLISWHPHGHQHLLVFQQKIKKYWDDQGPFSMDSIDGSYPLLSLRHLLGQIDSHQSTLLQRQCYKTTGSYNALFDDANGTERQ